MNPLFASYQKRNRQNNQQFDMQTALRNLANQIAPTGLTPEQIVRQKIQNKEMTQAQFEQLSRAADIVMSQFNRKR